MTISNPALFGLKNSNRDFTKLTSWGKNQFNSSFPASLCCYLHSKGINPVYLKLSDKCEIVHDKISVTELFGIAPNSEKVFFSFETEYAPYLPYILGNLPRIDLVVCELEGENILCKRGLEIKLTALPDQSTFEESPERQGCEIVVRPDTIVYAAIAIAHAFKGSESRLMKLIEPVASKITDWTSQSVIQPRIHDICNTINQILIPGLDSQEPLLLQPIWKTKQKSLALEDNCLDVFVWSNYAFTRLFINQNGNASTSTKISRHSRTAAWLLKMLEGYANTGKIEHEYIIDNMTFDTKNDKAFASNGLRTRSLLQCGELINPRINKNEIKNIILDGGEKMLSPERRFDAAILASPDLFISHND